MITLDKLCGTVIYLHGINQINDEHYRLKKCKLNELKISLRDNNFNLCFARHFFAFFLILFFTKINLFFTTGKYEIYRI